MEMLVGVTSINKAEVFSILLKTYFITIGKTMNMCLSNAHLRGNFIYILSTLFILFIAVAIFGIKAISNVN